MNASVHDAFRAANVPDEEARAGAEDLAGYASRPKVVGLKLDGVKSQVDLLNWMVGANTASTITVPVPLLVV